MPPTKPEIRVLQTLARPGEEPWLLINSQDGTVAAFEDRVAVVKAGFIKGVTSGAAFGGRQIVFDLREIGGIEFTAGLSYGYLEVVSASYPRSGVRPNTESANKLPNVIMLWKKQYKRAAPHITELQTRIAAAKRGVVVSQPPPPPPIHVPPPPPPAIPPGWQPDPTGRHQHRYWDGAQWTAHVVTAGTQHTDPL